MNQIAEKHADAMVREIKRLRELLDQLEHATTDGVLKIASYHVENLQHRGYEELSGCDAAKANGDAIRVMIRRMEGQPDEIAVVCPTFLRGPIRFKSSGSISY